VDRVDDTRIVDLKRPEPELQGELDAWIAHEITRKKEQAAVVKQYVEDLVADYQTKRAKESAGRENLMMEYGRIVHGTPRAGKRTNQSKRRSKRAVR
jgi:hypothetical protein